jgi:hypothetical protein
MVSPILPFRGEGTCTVTSAADLKFLHHLPQARSRNFKSKSGARTIDLLVPLRFRSSCQRVLRCITKLRKRGTRADFELHRDAGRLRVILGASVTPTGARHEAGSPPPPLSQRWPAACVPGRCDGCCVVIPTLIAKPPHFGTLSPPKEPHWDGCTLGRGQTGVTYGRYPVPPRRCEAL